MKSRINESFSVEKKIVSDEWKNDDMPGLHIKQAVVVEKFSEKPIYVTNTGTEIASWELPGLPREYLDAIGFNKNASFSEVSEEGYTSTHGIYLKPINRAEVQYIHNAVNKNALMHLIESVVDNTQFTVGTSRYNAAGTQVASTTTAFPVATVAPLAMILGTGTGTAGVDDASLGTYKTSSNQVFVTDYPRIDQTAAAITGNPTTGTAGTAVGIYDTIEWKCTWAPGTATDTALTEVALVDSTTNDAGKVFSHIFFASSINKQTADTLNVTIKWVLA